jgi:hypothetical protein
VQHWNFNPGKNGLILDSEHQLGAALTGADRRIVQRQLDELVRASPLADSAADECHWTSLRIAADPAVEGAGAITLQVREGGEVMSVGVTRSNILNVPAGSEFAAGVVKARLRVELKSTPAQKTARGRCRERSGAAAATASDAAEAIGERHRFPHREPNPVASGGKGNAQQRPLVPPFNLALEGLEERPTEARHGRTPQHRNQ